MAISPIDLQTLFTQIDKVGKQVAAQKEGAAIQQDIQQAQIQRHTDEKIRSVNETQDQGEGAEGVKDRNARKFFDGGESSRRGSRERNGKETEETDSVISDPNLGKNIDVSL